jgi:hypothetical protein
MSVSPLAMLVRLSSDPDIIRRREEPAEAARMGNADDECITIKD